MLKEDFTKRARDVHGDKYIYDKVPNEFNVNDNLTIICPIHGEFIQCARAHYRGHGCSKCGFEKTRESRRLTTESFLKKYEERFGKKYDTSLAIYKDFETKIKLICPKHGIFERAPDELMRGKGCPKCGIENGHLLHRLDSREVFERARNLHNGKYSYDKFVYTRLRDKGIITCPIHGDFEQTMRKHLMGSGCPKCGFEKTRELLRKPLDKVIEECSAVHNGKYKYIIDFDYINTKSKVHVVCPIHGEFWQEIDAHLHGQGCPKCSHKISKWEKEVYDYLASLGMECEQSNRTILKGKEIDIFIPKHNIGIECDGLRWHNELYRDNNYHLNKTNECAENGIRLIHIFEDEWVKKDGIWKSMLRYMFGMIDEKIYARKCEVKDVPPNDCRKFLDNNYIQGYSNSKINYGLYYNDELVSLMTFGIPRINMGGKREEGCYELVRFCNKLNTNVIGGASKLFKHFIEMNNPTEIVSYSDKRWSLGNLYQVLGFKHTHDSKPNYFYVYNMNRLNRFRFRKSVLVNEGFDKDKSEHEIMLDRGIYRIYDCGTMVWKWFK